MQVTTTPALPMPVPTANVSANSPLNDAAKQFETLFVGQLLEAMRRTAPKGGALTPSRGEEQFRQLFDQEIAQRIADRGGIGIGEMLCRQLGEPEARPKTEEKLDANR